MRIKNLKLLNFRNFSQACVDLGEGVTIFYGGVGEGKTNLVESVGLLSLGRSYRVSDTRQVISWGREASYVRGEAESSSGSFSVAVKVTKAGKQIELNGESNKRAFDLIGGLRTVIFHSDDTVLVGGAPQSRRKFIDLSLSQASRNYLSNLRDYYRILKQRNAALLSHNLSGLDEWDTQLATTGSWLTQVREKVIGELGTAASQLLGSLAGSGNRLKLSYLMSGDPDPAAFRARLLRAHGLDISRGSTSVGPHRDEIRITLNGVDAKFYCSSGEKKSIAIALRLAEVEFIRSFTGEKPVVILDDLFSSLDVRRSRALLSVAGDGSQCIITSNDVSALKDIVGDSCLYEVRNGNIREASRYDIAA